MVPRTSIKFVYSITFMFCTFFSPLQWSRYLYIFSLSFIFWFMVHWNGKMHLVGLFFFWINTRSGLPIEIRWSVWFSKSQTLSFPDFWGPFQVYQLRIESISILWSVLLAKIIIIIIILTPALVDGISMEPEWLQVFSSLQDFIRDSGRPKKCSSLKGICLSSDFQHL